MANLSGALSTNRGIDPAVQAAIDQYTSTLKSMGYTGGRMGNAWWNQPQVQQALQQATDTIKPLVKTGYDPSTGSESQGTEILRQLPQGDKNPGNFLTDTLTNPVFQIGAGLISGGAALGMFGPTALGADLGLTAAPEAAASSSPGFLTSTGNGLGRLFGDPTLGTDIGSGLSKFADSTGLSSLFGGAPSTDLSMDAANNAASADTVAAASAPTSAAVGNAGTYLPTTGVSGLGGGASGGGFDVAAAGTPSALPSTAGVGGATDAVDNFASDLGADSSPLAPGAALPDANTAFLGAPNLATGANISVDTSPMDLNGVGLGAGSAPPSLSNLYGMTTPGNAGTFNPDFYGNPAGASSYSIPDQFANGANSLTPSGGGKVATPGILSSLFGGSGTPGNGITASVLNGLLKGGATALLSNNNNKGYNAQINAGQQVQQDYQPFLNSGATANTTLADLYGLNGTGAQTGAQQNWQNTPGFQFALQQGENAVNADAAAKGQTLSGNNQQAINNFAQGKAEQTYNDYIQNLANLSGQGVNAAGGVATGQLGIGNAQAGKSGQQANAQNTALGMGLNSLFPTGMSIQQLLSGLNTGGGGAGGYLSSMFG